MNYKLFLRVLFDQSLLSQALFFLLTQGFGLMLYAMYLEKPRTAAVAQNVIISTPLYFLIAFILLSLIFYLIITKIKGSAIVKSIFYLAMLEGIFLFFYSFLSLNIALAIAIAFLLIYLRYQTILFHNILLLLALSALGMVLATQFTLVSGAVMMVLLMIYDYISVKKTKQMVAMFKGLVEKKVYFGMLFPFVIKDYFSDLRDINLADGYFFLGTGDLALPLIIIINVSRYGLAKAIIVAVCAALSLILVQVYYLAKNIRQPLPGLVPLTIGSFVGLAISFLAF